MHGVLTQLHLRVHPLPQLQETLSHILCCLLLCLPGRDNEQRLRSGNTDLLSKQDILDTEFEAHQASGIYITPEQSWYLCLMVCGVASVENNSFRASSSAAAFNFAFCTPVFDLFLWPSMVLVSF